MTVARDFAERYGPWALVAGASEGIGASYARQLAQRGLNLALLARRSEPLDALARELRDEHGVTVRAGSIDLTGATMMDDVLALVDDADVGTVVYNAGAVHGARPFLDRPVDDAIALMNLNCRGPILLMHHFGAAMARRGRGALVLMTSMSAAAGGGYVAVYSATKAFDLILAEALWIELGQRGVDVLAVVAGLTDTPAMRGSGLLVDAAPVPAMAPDDVVDEALAALGQGNPVCVAGATNRQTAEHLWPASRPELVAAMTAASARLYGLPNLEQPVPRSDR